MILAAIVIALAGTPRLPHVEMKFDRHRTGTIKEIRSDALVIQDAKKKPVTVKTNDETIVYRNGRDTHLDALRFGDTVVVEVMPNDAGELDAVMVRAQAPPKPKKKAPAKTPVR